VILFGLRKEVRRMGLYPVLVQELITRGQAAGALGAEGSWIPEDDLDSIGPLLSLGARPHKRWRIYEKDLIVGRTSPP
jgi:hypothetical protein